VSALNIRLLLILCVGRMKHTLAKARALATEEKGKEMYVATLSADAFLPLPASELPGTPRDIVLKPYCLPWFYQGAFGEVAARLLHAQVQNECWSAVRVSSIKASLQEEVRERRRNPRALYPTSELCMHHAGITGIITALNELACSRYCDYEFLRSEMFIWFTQEFLQKANGHRKITKIG
jgi:hypothetical protein